MNQIQTFQKLVDLLGHSENEPEVQSNLSQLGIKFPLKKPKATEDNYLIEKSKIKCHLGVAYADSLPYLRDNEKLKEGELVFSCISNILEPEFNKFELPFGLNWEMQLKDVTKLLGSPFFSPADNWYYLWRKDNIVIRVEFYEKDSIYDLTFRWIWDYDLTH